MRFIYVDKPRPYTGQELRSHWALETFGWLGDSAVAFQGECSVPLENMVDLEDVIAGKHIYSRKMLHFIVEHFGISLEMTVMRQLLLVAVIKDVLGSYGIPVVRDGNDLYYEGGKLSVSVATISPVSGLIHVGINVDAEGAPVAAASLNEMNIDPAELADRVLKRYSQELEGVTKAIAKVRPVG